MRTAIFASFLAFFLTSCADAPPPAPVTPPAAPTAKKAEAQSESVVVHLLAFNDFHGNVKPPTGRIPKIDGEVGGAGYLAAHLKKFGAGKPDTIVVAAGDIIGASPLSSGLFHDEPTIEAMNAMGLSVTALGNHELDKGIDEALRQQKGGCHPKDGCKFDAQFPGAKYSILAANMTWVRSDTPPFPAYVIREVAGVQIAFVGMPLEDTPHSVTPEGVAGLAFADEVRIANGLVPEIKAKGASAIVLLIHQGGETQNPTLDGCNDMKGAIVNITEHLDPAYVAVVSGHTHALYNCKIAGRPVTSALSFGRAFTTIDLTIDRKTQKVTSFEAHNHAVTHDIPPDPTVQAIVDKASQLGGEIENRPIGHITEALSSHERGGGDSPLGDVVADAQLEGTKKQGARLALVNASGIRSDLPFKNDGVVTFGDAFAVHPFGNKLVTLTITGAQLIEVLDRGFAEGSGLIVSSSLEVHYRSEGKQRKVSSVKLDGKPLDPKGAVRLTTNSFIAERDPTLSKQGTSKFTGGLDLDALEAYFASHPKVSPPKAVRVIKDEK